VALRADEVAVHGCGSASGVVGRFPIVDLIDPWRCVDALLCTAGYEAVAWTAILPRVHERDTSSHPLPMSGGSRRPSDLDPVGR
jgi:hypothetical protein